MRESNSINKTAFDRAYRPYIGCDGINATFYPKAGPQATDMYFRAGIKNFGPVPGTDFIATWEVFFDGHPIVGVPKIPDSPYTLFPGQYAFLEARVGSENFRAFISGTKSLVIKVKEEYSGPQGHQKDCQKYQFIPIVNQFATLGACD
jgi:hypothetical protein